MQAYECEKNFHSMEHLPLPLGIKKEEEQICKVDEERSVKDKYEDEDVPIDVSMASMLFCLGNVLTFVSTVTTQCAPFQTYFNAPQR